MKLKEAISSYMQEDGLFGVIDENGEVIAEHRTSCISCDFLSSRYLVSIGELKDPFNHHN